MKVTLSSREMRVACHHAVDRYVAAIEKGFKPKINFNQPSDRTSVDFISCMAELALAKAKNLYWSAITGLGDSDVGPYEVRATSYQNGKLVVSEKDPDHKLVVLVICNPPEFNIVGFIEARKAKHPDYHFSNERGWCWMVPQGHLELFDEDKVKQVSSMGKDEWLFDL